jgi:hypothetical protein
MPANPHGCFFSPEPAAQIESDRSIHSHRGFGRKSR